MERLLNSKLLTIFFLFLIFDFEVNKFLDENGVSIFLQKNKDIKNLKSNLKGIYKMLADFALNIFSIFLFYFIFSSLWD